MLVRMLRWLGRMLGRMLGRLGCCRKCLESTATPVNADSSPAQMQPGVETVASPLQSADIEIAASPLQSAVAYADSQAGEMR